MLDFGQSIFDAVLPARTTEVVFKGVAVPSTIYRPLEKLYTYNQIRYR